MLLEDGDFSWLPPPKDMTLEENKKPKRKENSVMPSLNDSLLTEEQPTDFAFRIQDLKIKVPKGSLVFVIGKIGSGKSSLLYALVGEMKKSSNPENKTRLYTGDNMAMLSQTPWLIGSSIKVNILLDLPYDEQRFQRALRLSQLKDDVDNMADGIDTFIGENGSTVSGGQRTRIALARLIYQVSHQVQHSLHTLRQISVFSLVFGISILYIKIGDLSFIVLAVFTVGCIILILFYNLLLKIIDNLMLSKDRRVLVLTNIISNVKYIKLRAWENFFQYKMSGVRGLELKYLFHLMLFNCTDIFLGWMNLSLCQIAFVVSLTYLRPEAINVATVSSALGVLGILFTAIQWLPWYVGLLLGFVISLRRIRNFLEAEELDFGLGQLPKSTITPKSNS